MSAPTSGEIRARNFSVISTTGGVTVEWNFGEGFATGGGMISSGSSTVRTLDIKSVGGGSVNVVIDGDCTEVNGACADIAERITAPKNEQLESGDVLVIAFDKEEFVSKSTMPYDTKVVGIFTSKPAVYMGATEGFKIGGWDFRNLTEHNGSIPMALAGQVPIKVTNENGPIQKGDLLTTSSTPGHAIELCVD